MKNHNFHRGVRCCSEGNWVFFSSPWTYPPQTHLKQETQTNHRLQVLNLGIIFHCGTAGCLFFLLCLHFCLFVKVYDSFCLHLLQFPRLNTGTRSMRRPSGWWQRARLKLIQDWSATSETKNNSEYVPFVHISPPSVWPLSFMFLGSLGHLLRISVTHFALHMALIMQRAPKQHRTSKKIHRHSSALITVDTNCLFT